MMTVCKVELSDAQRVALHQHIYGRPENGRERMATRKDVQAFVESQIEEALRTPARDRYRSAGERSAGESRADERGYTGDKRASYLRGWNSVKP